MTAQLKRETISILTDGSGDFEVSTDKVINGGIYQLRYVPDATNPLATGADITIVGRDTGVVVATLTDIGTAAFTLAPRQVPHATDGTAGANSTELIILNEPLTITVAQGGADDAGTLYIWYAV
jgi:hypothetical protein